MIGALSVSSRSSLPGVSTLTLIALLASCGNGPASDDSVRVHGLTSSQAKELLAKIGPREITVGEFADRLASESPYIRPRYNNPDNRRDYLRNMVDFELLALEARREGLHQLPAIRRAQEDQMIEALLHEQVYGSIQASSISEDAIRADYEAHPEEYHQPEQRRAEHILVPDRNRAEQLLKMLRASEDANTTFRELVSRFTIDSESRPHFGDLRFFSEQPSPKGPARVPQSVRTAVFALEHPGDLAPTPIGSDLGFHVVRLRAIRPALERSLEDARRIIQSKLLRQKREAAVAAYVARLREELGVVTHLERLDALELRPSQEPSQETQVP